MTTQIKIETGFPLPTTRSGLRLALESLTVATGKPTDKSITVASQFAAHSAAHRSRIKIRTMKINGGGYRIWRIK